MKIRSAIVAAAVTVAMAPSFRAWADPSDDESYRWGQVFRMNPRGPWLVTVDIWAGEKREPHGLDGEGSATRVLEGVGATSVERVTEVELRGRLCSEVGSAATRRGGVVPCRRARGRCRGYWPGRPRRGCR